MFFLPRSVKVYVATQPVSLRNSFDGLCNEARKTLGKDPLTGHVLVFLNRRRNQVKLLVWTRGGFTIVHKKLERGTFAALRRVDSEASCVEFDIHELSMLLEGISFASVQASVRWDPPMHVRAL